MNVEAVWRSPRSARGGLFAFRRLARLILPLRLCFFYAGFRKKTRKQPQVMKNDQNLLE